MNATLPAVLAGPWNTPAVRFLAAWVFIAFVSVHDGYLVLKHAGVMEDEERNPVGLYLISLAGGEVWMLLGAKAVGTVLACAAMLILFMANPRLGLAVTHGVACFQFGLLLYLFVG
jgi:tryptophan-rich sensory protein